MKREYSDTNKDSSAVSAAAIFPNHHLHRSPHHFIQPYSSPLRLHQNPFPFQLAASHDVDEDSNSAAAATTPDPTRSQPDPNNSNDGASIEVQRRPRGRPPGSKNKPKPPVILTRQPDSIMSPTILEVPNGVDVIEALQTHSLRRRASLCILSASGAVVDVTIRQPSPNSSSTVTFHGRFEILSLSAAFIGPSSTQSSSHIPNNVAVSLSVQQGQIIGGIVAGPLTASGTVYVVAALFSSSACIRLPAEDEAVRNNTTSSGGNEEQSPPSAASGDNNNNGGGGDQSGGYNSCSLASDVIWTPSARQPY